MVTNKHERHMKPLQGSGLCGFCQFLVVFVVFSYCVFRVSVITLSCSSAFLTVCIALRISFPHVSFLVLLPAFLSSSL